MADGEERYNNTNQSYRREETAALVGRLPSLPRRVLSSGLRNSSPKSGAKKWGRRLYNQSKKEMREAFSQSPTALRVTQELRQPVGVKHLVRGGGEWGETHRRAQGQSKTHDSVVPLSEWVDVVVIPHLIRMIFHPRIASPHIPSGAFHVDLWVQSTLATGFFQKFSFSAGGF